MTPHESRDILASIVATWPNPLMPDIVMEAWIEELAFLNHAAARAAVKALIKTHTYRPTPAELVDLAALTPACAVLEYRPAPIEDVLPKDEQLARIHQLRSSLKHIDDVKPA